MHQPSCRQFCVVIVLSLVTTHFIQGVAAITCVSTTTCVHTSPNDPGGQITRRSFLMTGTVTNFNSANVRLLLGSVTGTGVMNFRFQQCTFVWLATNGGLYIVGSAGITDVMTLTITSCTFNGPIVFSGRMPPSSVITIFGNRFLRSRTDINVVPAGMGTTQFGNFVFHAFTMITTQFRVTTMSAYVVPPATDNPGASIQFIFSFFHFTTAITSLQTLSIFSFSGHSFTITDAQARRSHFLIRCTGSLSMIASSFTISGISIPTLSTTSTTTKIHITSSRTWCSHPLRVLYLARAHPRCKGEFHNLQFCRWDPCH